MELMNLVVRLKSNPDYNGEEELAIDRPVKSEEYVHSLCNKTGGHSQIFPDG